MRNEKPSSTTEEIAAKALPSAGRAMILTTITTTIAFWGSAICPVAPIKLFAIFCGLLIVFDYILDVAVMFPCLVIYDSYRFQRNYCVAFHTITVKEREEQDESHNTAAAAAAATGTAEQELRCGVEEEKMEEEEGHILLKCSRKGENSSSEFNSYDKPLPIDESCMLEELDMENTNLIRRILSGYYDFLHAWRWLILALSVAALCVCSYFATTLAIPENAADIQLLAGNVEYEENRQWRMRLLSDSLLKETGSQGFVIWGVVAADTGDHNDPQTWSTLELDEAFDPSTEAAQLYLRDFCDNFFKEDFADPFPDEFAICPMQLFDMWLKTQSMLPIGERSAAYVDYCVDTTGLPMDRNSFHLCLSSWAHQEKNVHVLSWDNIVKIIYLPFKSRVRYNLPSAILGKEWHLIESWMKEQSQLAPIEVANGFFTSFDWWWWDTSENVYQTARTSGSFAIAVAAVVILLSSRSVTMTLFSAVSVAFVLLSVTSLMSAANWTLGFL